MYVSQTPVFDAELKEHPDLAHDYYKVKQAALCEGPQVLERFLRSSIALPEPELQYLLSLVPDL